MWIISGMQNSWDFRHIGFGTKMISVGYDFHQSAVALNQIQYTGTRSRIHQLWISRLLNWYWQIYTLPKTHVTHDTSRAWEDDDPIESWGQICFSEEGAFPPLKQRLDSSQLTQAQQGLDRSVKIQFNLSPKICLNLMYMVCFEYVGIASASLIYLCIYMFLCFYSSILINIHVHPLYVRIYVPMYMY